MLIGDGDSKIILFITGQSLVDAVLKIMQDNVQRRVIISKFRKAHNSIDMINSSTVEFDDEVLFTSVYIIAIEFKILG